ncbi:synaptobrevin homolog YKT6-like [Anneissia japonica]|uniref:synaptobrevin homolog YKT6-like n=1 Tax=Anneissia japonica TaxID=1529436 RepID=UPI0014257FC2|nr:synaptobrevin homolog YKT6-like [Anneissia japonica]
MKTYSLTILLKGSTKVLTLKAAYDLSSFCYSQRKSVQEFMHFTSQIIVERTQLGVRTSVTKQDYLCHAYIRNDSLAGVLIADHEYPNRVAFSLISKVLDSFAEQVKPNTWHKITENNADYSGLDEFIANYQNPRETDAITRIQTKLYEKQDRMQSTLNDVLHRGEELDDLVSKTFHKTVRLQLVK